MRQAAALAQHVAKLIKPGQDYHEPFCGAMGSARKTVPVALANKGTRVYLSDTSKPLMTMWTAAFDGWKSPTKITRKLYDKYSVERPDDDPLTAFLGFGCSFGGRWFETYPGIGKDNLAEVSGVSIAKKVNAIKSPRVTLRCQDYRKVTPKGCLLYLDPPYADTAKRYSHKDEFNTDEFWQYARDLVKRDNTVLVTSFKAPSDFVPVFSWGDTVTYHAHRNSVQPDKPVINESIYMHKSQAKRVAQ